MGLELTELPSYLTDESLSREEKLEKMDDLKSLYDEMVERVACFETRCEYMDKLLKILAVKNIHGDDHNMDIDKQTEMKRCKYSKQ